MPYSDFSKDQRQLLLTGLRQLCRFFWGPDIEQCREILEGRFFNSFCAAENPGASGFAFALKQMDACIRWFSDSETLFQSLETTYVRLFISSRGGITVPLYQSAFEGACLMGASAVKMKRRLEAVGLDTTGHAAGEPPDHLAIELEYLYFLLEKGDADQNAALIRDAQRFAAEELRPWTQALDQRLGQALDPALYAPAASLTAALVRLLSEE